MLFLVATTSQHEQKNENAGNSGTQATPGGIRIATRRTAVTEGAISAKFTLPEYHIEQD